MSLSFLSCWMLLKQFDWILIDFVCSRKPFPKGEALTTEPYVGLGCSGQELDASWLCKPAEALRRKASSTAHSITCLANLVQVHAQKSHCTWHAPTMACHDSTLFRSLWAEDLLRLLWSAVGRCIDRERFRDPPLSQVVKHSKNPVSSWLSSRIPTLMLSLCNQEPVVISLLPKS